MGDDVFRLCFVIFVVINVALCQNQVVKSDTVLEFVMFWASTEFCYFVSRELVEKIFLV